MNKFIQDTPYKTFFTFIVLVILHIIPIYSGLFNILRIFASLLALDIFFLILVCRLLLKIVFAAQNHQPKTIILIVVMVLFSFLSLNYSEPLRKYFTNLFVQTYYCSNGMFRPENDIKDNKITYHNGMEHLPGINGLLLDWCVSPICDESKEQEWYKCK